MVTFFGDSFQIDIVSDTQYYFFDYKGKGLNGIRINYALSFERNRGIRDTLINARFSTIKSILECTTSDISGKIGVDLYVAQIIIKEAMRFKQNLTKSSIPNFVPTVPTKVATDTEEIFLV